MTPTIADSKQEVLASGPPDSISWEGHTAMHGKGQNEREPSTAVTEPQSPGAGR